MTRNQLLHAAAVASLLLLPAGRISAQAEIIVRTPEEWDIGRSAPLAAGDTLHIAGTAFHPNGILRVLVNDRDASLTRNPQFVNTVSFAASMVPSAGTSRVIIRIVPATGDAFSQEFVVEATPVARPTPAPQPQVTPQQQPAASGPPANDPWRGMKMRGIGYVALAGVGVALGMMTKKDSAEICEPTGAGQDCFLRTTTTASYKTLGLGLVAGAAAMGIVDAIATSRRAGRAPQPERRGDARSPTPHFGTLTIGEHNGRINASLVVIRF